MTHVLPTPPSSYAVRDNDWEVSDPHDTMTDVSRWGSETPLVGRAEEISTMVDTLTASLDGQASAVLLAGDAGVGKTRLLGEVIRIAANDGFTVLAGHCVDIGEVGLPYLPFSEILGRIAQDPELDTVLQRHPEATRLLRTDNTAAAPDRGVSPRLQLFAAITELFTDLSTLRPLLVVVEDLHWADQSTRELLHFVLSRLRTARITVIASYRADDLHRRHPLRPLLAELVRLPGVLRRHLDPLPDRDVAALLSALHPRRISEPAMQGIISRAEGNAFYAEELLAATIDASMPGGAGAVPDGLADVLLTRLEQLPPTAQRVVRIASVAGRRVDHDLLREAADLPEDELETALREAIGRHLLVSEDGSTYSFRHALLREAAYADLLPGERVRIHATFARLLSEPGRGAEYAAARAHHFRASHDLPGALRASLEAADQATLVGAPAEELSHLENVLEMWSAVPDSVEIAGHSDVVIMLRASTAAVQAGDPSRAVALTRGALDRLSPHADAELAARVRYTLAKNLMGVDSDEAAFKESSAAMEAIPADPPSETWVWAATTHVQTSFYVGDYDGAREIGARALAVAERLAADDALADLLITLTGLMTTGRSTPPGREQLQRAHELAIRSGNVSIELRAVFNLAIGAYEGGDLQEALRRSREGAKTATRVGLGMSTYGVELRFIESLATYALGLWDECLAIVTDVEASGLQHIGHIPSVGLGVLTGRGVTGVTELVRTGIVDALAHPVYIINQAGNAIDEATWRQDTAAAVDWFDRATEAMLERWPEPGLAHLRLCGLALAAIADQISRSRLAEDEPSVTRWLAEAERIAALAPLAAPEPPLELDEQVGPEAVAWRLRCEAEHARATLADDVVAQWRGVVEAFGYGHVYEQARSRWRLAEVLVGADRREEAAVEADLAHAVAVRLGATPLREALESLVRRARLSSDADTAGPTSGPVVTLTPREHDVLTLVVRGRSNRQIGSELFISDKTASVHVSNILTKLGAASRTEAAAIAHRDGLV